MSGASRRRESLTPSLFPFLAVLLCTMGALVLILMLLVSGAQTTAQETARQADEEFQWEQEKLRKVKNGLNGKYEEAKIQLEKKRLVLQNYEKHIQELIEELEQLEKKNSQAELKHDTQKKTEKERDQLRELLEKQLSETKEKLNKPLDDPKGDKPIFAIIPYDGPNGTHRRPIYLECNEKGIVVQPEGVVLSPADLQPPYGPGNPLDAVLRTIRAEYPAKNGAVTYNPYPLLVVRPSGIKHYMMARAAMTGWDDQHGYELISQDLELTFPPSVPGLDEKIVSTIELARQRQAALVMAMPQHYDASQLDTFNSSGGGFSPSANLDGFDDQPLNSSSGSSTAARSQTGLRQSNRGGVSLLGSSTDSTNTNPLNNTSLNTSSNASSELNPMSQASNLGQGNLTGVASNGSNPPGSFADSTSGTGPMSFFGSGGNDGFGTGAAGSAGSTGSPSAGSLADNQTDKLGSSRNGSGGFSNDAGQSGTAGSNDGSGDSSSNGAAQGGGTSANSGSSASRRTSNGQASTNGSSGTAAPFGGGSQNSLGSNSASSPSSQSSSADVDPNQAGGIPSVNFDVSKKPSENVKPVAQSRGRNWAWRDGNRSQTAIVRAIRMQCYSDRWILLPEKGNNSKPTIITFDGPPIEQAEKLAQSVGQRVEGWGVALSEGHWAPVLHVDVAGDADWRFQQLQRLMEGSGIDVIRKAKLAPPVR